MCLSFEKVGDSWTGGGISGRVRHEGEKKAVAYPGREPRVCAAVTGQPAVHLHLNTAEHELVSPKLSRGG